MDVSFNKLKVIVGDVIPDRIVVTRSGSNQVTVSVGSVNGIASFLIET